MSTNINTSRPLGTSTQRLVLAVTVMALMFVAAAGAQAAGPPVKLVLATPLGREVNLTQIELKSGLALEDLCTTTSHDTCQPGTASTIAGGFTYPESVAGAPDGNVFVADQGNARIDEFTASGEFVLMFGKDVNPTATNKDLCTAASKNTCAAGEKGGAAGQFYVPRSVAVDPVSGDVYVAESVQGEAGGNLTEGQRVQKFTAGGELLLEIGKEVNETTKGNLCTKEEKCTAPAEYAGTYPENGHGAFHFAPGFQGNLLAVGGEHDRLYVAGTGSIQEFEPGGSWSGEMALPGSEVTAIAIEPASDAIYAIYDQGDVVHRLSAAGHEISSFTVSPREAVGWQAEVTGIAIDRSSHLALTVVETPEEGNGSSTSRFGALYEAPTGNLLTEFTFDGQSVKGISFNMAETASKELSDELFAAGINVEGVGPAMDVLGYHPVPVAELSTGSAVCAPGGDSGSSATLDCTVEGHANPYSVASTRVWFEWGATCALGSETAKQALGSVTESLPVHATVAGLRPDSAFCYRLAGDDANVQAPEQLTGEKQEVKQLPSVPPRVIGTPGVSFVHSSSAVMFGELNPENAQTEYAFEYGACENLDECSTRAHTAAVASNAYGRIGVTLEATGLRPATVYRYRLHAINEAGEEGECFEGAQGACEGSFTTAPAPVLAATTEGATAVGATSAVISGSVDPDGQLASYAFELGVYQGAATQYGVVQSGSTETVPVTEALPLSGLQPGTEYAYRITIASGYGAATGQPMTFTTAGLPSVLAVPAPLAMLAIPNIVFPGPAVTVNQPTPKCKAKYMRDKQGTCVKTKPKQKQKKQKKQKKRAKKAKRPKRPSRSLRAGSKALEPQHGGL